MYTTEPISTDKKDNKMVMDTTMNRVLETLGGAQVNNNLHQRRGGGSGVPYLRGEIESYSQMIPEDMSSKNDVDMHDVSEGDAHYRSDVERR